MTKNKIIIAKSENEDIKLNNAKRIVDYNGCILKKDVLSQLKKEYEVRISMRISKKSNIYKDNKKIYSDSPYVRIIDIKNNYVLGEILDRYRNLPEHYYPLRTGERIWFLKHNIIEICGDVDLEKYRSKEYVKYTGPLETIDDEDESSDESESDSSDSDNDISIDRSKLDIRVAEYRHSDR